MVLKGDTKHGGVASLLASLHNVQAYQVVLVLLLALITRIFFLAFLHPLRHIPGPFAARFTELWRTRRYALGQWHQDIVQIHRKYGPVVRISPNEVSFVDRAALLQVYGHATGTKKTNWYDVWHVEGNGEGFFAATDPKTHAFLRKRVASAYSMSTMLSLEPRIQQILNMTWDVFRQKAAQGQVVDLGKWSTYFAFDVVGTLGLGGPLDFVRQGGDGQGIISSIHALFFMSAILGNMPGQMSVVRSRLFRLLSRLLGFGGAEDSGNLFRDWLTGQVRARMEAEPDEKRTKDMLDHFISMKEVDGSPVQFPGVLIEAGNLIGAGADTTSAGIANVLGMLIAHPADFKRAQREVDEACAALSPGEMLDYRIAKQLPFLDACIKEALRLLPSIVWQLPREAPRGGITIAGHYVPESAILSMNPVAQNRDTATFGEDADQWRPERYLVGDDEQAIGHLKEMEKFTVTFGFGSRICIGRHLAMVEITKFVAQFLQQFDCSLVSPRRPTSTRSQWFCVHSDLVVTLETRK